MHRNLLEVAHHIDPLRCQCGHSEAEIRITICIDGRLIGMKLGVRSNVKVFVVKERTAGMFRVKLQPKQMAWLVTLNGGAGTPLPCI